MSSLSVARDPSAERAYEPHELLLSMAFSAGMIVSFFMLLVVAGASSAHVVPTEAAPPNIRPIAVKPILDDAPLLKLGGKKVRQKLPEMWKKNPPVQRFEAASAPSPKAEKNPATLPSSPLAKPDAGPPPPPDAEVAKQVDQVLLDAAPEETPTVEGEGSPDGVKEGTEVDPLKARAQSQYLARIVAFFNGRFVPPVGEVPCDELKALGASAVVTIGGSREITGFSLTRPSGNAAFDARVQSTLSGMMGLELPPPPPLYPDILGTSVQPRFSGGKAQCE